MGEPKMWVRAAALVVLAVVLGGCVPWWDGTADLYALPSPGGGGAQVKAPGTLERVQRVASSRFRGVDVYRVAYWTTDRIDRPQIATGLVTVPIGEPPVAGRPLIAYDHGTTGMASQCAPSRIPDGLPQRYVESGVPVVAPDYIG